MAEHGRHPNSLKALEQHRERTQFRGERAVKAGRKGIESQAFTRALLSAVADKVDIDKASEQLKEQIERGNLAAWDLWCKYTASKPATRVEAEIEDRTLHVIIDNGSED